MPRVSSLESLFCNLYLKTKELFLNDQINSWIFYVMIFLTVCRVMNYNTMIRYEILHRSP